MKLTIILENEHGNQIERVFRLTSETPNMNTDIAEMIETMNNSHKPL